MLVHLVMLLKVKQLQQHNYAAGADVVYQAAGGTGAGVFAEAKSLNESRPENEKFGLSVLTVTK